MTNQDSILKYDSDNNVSIIALTIYSDAYLMQNWGDFHRVVMEKINERIGILFEWVSQ